MKSKSLKVNKHTIKYILSHEGDNIVMTEGAWPRVTFILYIVNVVCGSTRDVVRLEVNCRILE